MSEQFAVEEPGFGDDAAPPYSDSSEEEDQVVVSSGSSEEEGSSASSASSASPGSEDSGEAGPLPPGWAMAFDKATGRPYFVDHNTQTTTFDDPREHLGRGELGGSDVEVGRRGDGMVGGSQPPSSLLGTLPCTCRNVTTAVVGIAMLLSMPVVAVVIASEW
jgi:WW domain